MKPGPAARRVGVDVDGVLADLLTPGLQLLAEMTGKETTPHHLTEWDFDKLIPEGRVQEFWERMGAQGVCSSFEPYPGSVEGMAMLGEVCDVYVVTAHLGTGATWAYERDRWLSRHFGIPRSRIVHTQAKYVFHGVALVDDKPLNVEQWARAHPGQLPVLWMQPYNKNAQFHPDVASSVVRTGNWRRLRDLVEEHVRGRADV